MAVHNGQLPRGKRRGDCKDFDEPGYLIGNAGDFYHNRKDVPVIVAEAKRRCLEPTPFAEWNRAPGVALNGYHQHLRDQEPQCLPVMQTDLTDTQMDLSTERLNCAITSNGHANGFELGHQDNNFHHHLGRQQTDLKGGGEPAAPVLSNGYYGYIAHYEHAGSDGEENSMDTGAEYAINGPSSCIEPKERRVCLRCSAGEPGHITHIMHPSHP